MIFCTNVNIFPDFCDFFNTTSNNDLTTLILEGKRKKKNVNQFLKIT